MKDHAKKRFLIPSSPDISFALDATITDPLLIDRPSSPDDPTEQWLSQNFKFFEGYEGHGHGIGDRVLLFDLWGQKVIPLEIKDTAIVPHRQYLCAYRIIPGLRQIPLTFELLHKMESRHLIEHSSIFTFDEMSRDRWINIIKLLEMDEEERQIK